MEEETVQQGLDRAGRSVGVNSFLTNAFLRDWSRCGGAEAFAYARRTRPHPRFRR